jgi:hopanoid-associated phosphorylase
MAVEAARVRAAGEGLPESERPYVGVAGGSAERAAYLSQQHVAAGVRGLVSFGVAGGLDPSLRPGDLVIATAVWRRSDEAAIGASETWGRSIEAAVGTRSRVHTGVIAGVDAPVISAAQKRVLHTDSTALAVDMESHGIAAAAVEAALPLLVIRAIADPATRTIPAAALAGMGDDGRLRPMAVLHGLLASPGDLPGLIRLARDSAAAMRSLSVAAQVLMEAGST